MGTRGSKCRDLLPDDLGSPVWPGQGVRARWRGDLQAAGSHTRGRRKGLPWLLTYFSNRYFIKASLFYNVYVRKLS